MKEKLLIGLWITLAAVVATNVIISPLKTVEVKLLTSPAGDIVNVPARQLFNVTCQGYTDDGSKFSSIEWVNKDGNVISEGNSVQKDGENSLKLIFTDPKMEDSGVYKCKAVYDNAHTLEKVIEITFFGSEPEFELSFENITVEEGSQVKVNCSALGDEPLVYEWYKYEDKISEDANSTIFVSNNESRSTLIIRKVAKSDEGMYTCLAKNAHGQSSKIYQLTVLPSTGNQTDDGILSILNIEVGNITSTSVTFLIATSGSVGSIKVRYWIQRNTFNTKVWKYGDDYEIKDLAPARRYNFQFMVVDPSENSTWSKVYQVVLLPPKPELIFNSLDGGSVKVQWFLKTDDVMLGTIDQYELKYYSVGMQGGNYWVPSDCVTTIQIPTCKGRSYIIANLYKNAYFEIQIRAHTESGYGEASKQKVYIS